MANNVIFKTGTKAQYDAITTKNKNTLYWLYDVLEIRKGDDLYAKGSLATSVASGLMSAEDKAKLDSLSGDMVMKLTPVDASVIVDNENGSTSIGVQISKKENNMLKLVEDGLFTSMDESSLKTVDRIKYEVHDKPVGTIVDYRDKEIRVMCPSNTQWEHQSSGDNADKNKYYIGFRAYAPGEDVVSFKEDLSDTITDQTMYYFDGNDFAGIDEYGRKYSVVWLPVASYDITSGLWSYYGDGSTSSKYIGWYYSVEWYNEDGILVSSDTVRINLSNEECHSKIEPFYVPADLEDIKSTITTIEKSYTWGEI